MSKVVTFLLNEEKKVIDWVKSKEPQFVSDMQAAASFTTKALAWVASPQGIAAGAVINSFIATAPKWEAEATTIAESLLTDMLAVKSPAALQGIAVRLGAELLQIFDGKKLPTGISGYLQEFQAIFVG